MIIYLASGEMHALTFEKNTKKSSLLSYYDLAQSTIPFRKWTWECVKQIIDGIPIQDIKVNTKKVTLK